MSSPDAPRQSSEDLTFEQELAEVERSLQELKTRHTQVQQDEATQATLRQRQAELKAGPRSPQTKAELAQIQDKLDELELNLESRLFTWDKPFWQIIRFGGVGLVLGWLFAFAVLQSPKPAPPPAPNSNPTTQP